MNCPFCATGQAGLTRNMSTAEILDQIVQANRVIAEGGLGGQKRDDHDAERVSNIVFMGMGEPLANYKRVMNAVHRMVADAPEGLGMSARGITVSTVGLVPAINKLAEEDIPVTFALSLHAPDDELRDELIPVNSRWKVDEALDAARNYFDEDRPPRLDRVRADQGHERPRLARRPAGRASSTPAAAAGCT